MAWSISLLNLDQLAFFRLKRLLKGQCMAVTGDLMVIVIGRCCVRGMGPSTPLWHIEAILVLTNATSGLYPLFHRALSKDLGSFASWMREKLEASAHASTRLVSIAVILLVAPCSTVRVEVTYYKIERSSAPFR